MYIYKIDKNKILKDTRVMFLISFGFGFVGFSVVELFGFVGYFFVLLALHLFMTALLSRRKNIKQNKDVFLALKDKVLYYYNLNDVLFSFDLDDIDLEFNVKHKSLFNNYRLVITRKTPIETGNGWIIYCRYVQGEKLFADLQTLKAGGTLKGSEDVIDLSNVCLYSYGDDDKGVLTTFDEYSVLKLTKFPPNNKKFAEADLEKLDTVLSEILGVAVESESDLTYKIHSTSLNNIHKLRHFLTNGYQDLNKIVGIITHDDKSFVNTFSELTLDRAKFSEDNEQYQDMSVLDVFLKSFANIDMAYDYCLAFDQSTSYIEILEQLKVVLSNLKYEVPLEKAEFSEGSTYVAVTEINIFLGNYDYGFIHFNNPNDNEGNFCLFVVPTEKIVTLQRLGKNIGFRFYDCDCMY